MGIRSGDEYRDSLRDGRQVWMHGERVEDVTKHPAFQPMVDAIARMYDMQHEARYQEVMTFQLPSGERASRFYKLPETPEDLAGIRAMTLALLDEVGGVVDRFGSETATPLFVMYDRRPLLAKYDPRYVRSVEHWLQRCQAEDLFMTSGNTDPKGDRSKQPFEQDDPDLYLRVVSERDDGILIRGAKYETGAAYAHVAFVKPTVGQWRPENRDYAVACIVPLNSPGLKHICRAPLLQTAQAFDRPLSSRFDEIDTLMVFEDVLVPWDSVIFCRQPELASLIRHELHRWGAHAYLLRSLAKADLLVGTACLLAEQNRSIASPAVKEEIAHLMVYREAVHAFILASEAACERTESGLVMPNQSIAYAGRLYTALHYHEMVHVLRNLAGGSAVLIPDERTLRSPETGPCLEKYYRVGATPAEDRLRVLNLAAELSSTSFAGHKQAYQLFAESPPANQAMILYGAYDREASMRRARRIVGLGEPAR